MKAKAYFEDVLNASKRADALMSVADTLDATAGAVKALQYDRVQGGVAKGGAKNVDSILNTVSRVDAARDRAIGAREVALSLVSEASAIIERALEDPDADVPCLLAVHEYYLRGRTDSEIAALESVDVSRINRRRHRGLSKLEPLIPR
jgi:DNA-directed RNA polymerase specialized sigma24 family protein